MTTIRPAALLGLDVRSSSATSAEVVIPFTENCNDKAALFAGSLFSGAVLAGYYLVQNRMRADGIGGTLVCKNATVSYLRPLTSDAVARARADGTFSATPRGNRHLSVDIDIVDTQNAVCCTCRCDYVIMA